MSETENIADNNNNNENDSKLTVETVEQNNPLIIKQLKSNHSQPIKISIINKGENKNEIQQINNNNDVYENYNNNKQQETEIENIQVNPETKKHTEYIESNNTINNNKVHMKNYTAPLLLNNQQFNLRYKDPRTGKLFSKIIVDNNNSTEATKSTGDESLSNFGVAQDTNRKMMLTSRSNKNTSKTNLSGPVAISLYRSDTTITKDKSITTERTYSFRNDDTLTPRSYEWKAKNDRIPVKLAPDRSYINTYMDHYANKNVQRNVKTANSAKINNIKFQGVSPYGETKKETDVIITTAQMFEQIFDMNSQFLNTYFPNSRKNNSAKSALSRTHTLPGHIALESVKNNQKYIVPSKRPLKFENPALYRPTKSALNTNRSVVSDATSVYDVESIEIPILLKSPSSVNSYISYLRRRNNNNLFQQAAKV
jgi:hypothetical protein